MAAYNKVIYHGKTLIDLTSDTVTADALLDGYIAHDKSGNVITGTFLSDFPTSFEFVTRLQDDDGNDLLDSNSANFDGVSVYAR